MKTKEPETICIKLVDYERPEVVYTRRYHDIVGEDEFTVRLPQSPKKGVLYVYNRAVGDLKKGEDGTFEVIGLKKDHLDTKVSVFDWRNKDIRNFVKFAQEFCERSPYLASGTDNYYLSDCGKFKIHYLDDIKSVQTGRSLNTPARISQATGRIEVSKAKFSRLTVPQQIAILLHEFSHYYKNGNMADEEEADYNAVTIYLGLGYPKIEILRVFANVFYKADTAQNRKRYLKLFDYVNNFDKRTEKIIFN